MSKFALCLRFDARIAGDSCSRPLSSWSEACKGGSGYIQGGVPGLDDWAIMGVQVQDLSKLNLKVVRADDHRTEPAVSKGAPPRRKVSPSRPSKKPPAAGMP